MPFSSFNKTFWADVRFNASSSAFGGPFAGHLFAALGQGGMFRSWEAM
jgi:hypothetical protein